MPDTFQGLLGSCSVPGRAQQVHILEACPSMRSTSPERPAASLCNPFSVDTEWYSIWNKVLESSFTYWVSIKGIVAEFCSHNAAPLCRLSITGPQRIQHLEQASQLLVHLIGLSQSTRNFAF